MIEKLNKFIEDHIVMDEIDGIERTLVEFNFNDWIRFKRENFDKKEEIEITETPVPGIEPGPGKKLTDLVPKVKSDVWKKKPGYKKGTKRVPKSKKLDHPKKFTPEVDKYIKENTNMSNEDIAYNLKIEFDVDTTPGSVANRRSVIGAKSKKKEQTEGEGIQDRVTKLFPEEIDDFIKENWENNRDIDLVELLENKFNKTYNVDQVKAHRRQKGWVSSKPGRKKGQKAIVSTESDRKPLKAKQQKYPDELKDFCIENIGEMRNQELLEAANEKFDLNLDYNRLASYLKYNNIKREKVKKKIDKQKVGKPKKYTDEVLQFLRDNINNFKNKELCEELESRFNIKVSPDTLGQTMNNKGIKRDRQEEEEVDQEIIDFIQKSKTKDAYILRDKIIEKFEKNIPIRKIINFMAKKKEELPGESVEEEVQRVEKKRDELDEEIDDLDLDN